MSVSLAAQLRLRGRVPHVEVITRSYAMQVRDAALARIQVMPFFQGFKFKKSHALVIQAPTMMPCCCVYFMGEEMGADGNANTGEIRFQSDCNLGFSVFMINNDPDAMEDKLDFAHQAIFNGLLRDPTFRLSRNYEIESFPRAKRRHIYGQTGGLQNNETPYAELRAELTCCLGAIEYEPIEETMLETVHVETIHPLGDPAAPDNQTEHVNTIYDVNTLSDIEVMKLTTLPVNTKAPALSVSMTPIIGSVLTVNNGVWINVTSFTYQWQNNGVDITGATHSTYIVSSGDVGAVILCIVIAKNANGSSHANSNSVTIQ